MEDMESISPGPGANLFTGLGAAIRDRAPGSAISQDGEFRRSEERFLRGAFREGRDRLQRTTDVFLGALLGIGHAVIAIHERSDLLELELRGALPLLCTNSFEFLREIRYQEHCQVEVA